MKLIKIAHNQYVIADDSEIQEGDLVFNEYQRQIKKFHAGSGIGLCRKITYSTQPLEYSSKIGKYWGRVQPIELSEVKELIGEVDVFTVVEQWSKSKEKFVYQYWNKPSFIEGYNQALEDNKEKKWTDEDLRKAYNKGALYGSTNNGNTHYFDAIIQSLQPKTEWEVEFVDGKLALKK